MSFTKRAELKEPTVIEKRYAESRWGKRVGFEEAYRLIQRHMACECAYVMRAWRSIEPDEDKRNKMYCDVCYEYARDNLYSAKARAMYEQILGIPAKPREDHGHYIGVQANWGDELNLMPGRVQEFGPERVEKELDACPWDIVGPELCMATILCIQAGADNWSGQPGKYTALMSEALNRGDLHCRATLELANKLPSLARHERDHKPAGPVHFTPAAEPKAEPQVFEKGGIVNPLDGSLFPKEQAYAAQAGYSTPMNWQLKLLRKSEPDDEKRVRALREAFSIAGVAEFAWPHAIAATRAWLGVPDEVNDARVLGAFDELTREIYLTPATTIEFGPERVVRELDYTIFTRGADGIDEWELVPAWDAYYKSVAQNLVGTQWTASVTKDDDRVRIVFARPEGAKVTPPAK